MKVSPPRPATDADIYAKWRTGISMHRERFLSGDTAQREERKKPRARALRKFSRAQARWSAKIKFYGALSVAKSGEGDRINGRRGDLGVSA